MIEAFDIKRSVSMTDAVERYLPDLRILHHRIPCPFHGGQDNNLRIYKDSFYCFVCHESGDTFRFVQTLFGLGFQETLRKIDADFSLGLSDTEQTDAERRKALRERQRRAEQRAVAEYDAWLRENRKQTLLDIERSVDLIATENAPQTAWDEWTPEWCEALRLREIVKEKIESG